MFSKNKNDQIIAANNMKCEAVDSNDNSNNNKKYMVYTTLMGRLKHPLTTEGSDRNF